MIKKGIDMINILNEKSYSKMKEFLIKIGREFFFIIIIILSFSFGYVSRILHQDVNNSKNMVSKKSKDLSISIDTKGNLLIIDKDGLLTQYEDSVGIKIFNFYASKIAYDIKQIK